MWSQFKFFSPVAEKRLRLSDPRGRPANWRNGCRADSNFEDYDKWLKYNVCHARHALAIDEIHRDFLREKWAMPAEEKKTKGCKPVWLKPVWFSWCHSYIGGSYLKPDTSLSNITLE